MREMVVCVKKRVTWHDFWEGGGFQEFEGDSFGCCGKGRLGFSTSNNLYSK